MRLSKKIEKQFGNVSGTHVNSQKTHAEKRYPLQVHVYPALINYEYIEITKLKSLICYLLYNLWHLHVCTLLSSGILTNVK